MKTLVKYLFQEMIEKEAESFIQELGDTHWSMGDDRLGSEYNPSITHIPGKNHMPGDDPSLMNEPSQPNAPQNTSYDPSEIEGGGGNWFKGPTKTTSTNDTIDSSYSNHTQGPGVTPAGVNMGAAAAAAGVAAAGVAYLVYKKMKAARMAKGEPARMAGANASKAAMIKLKQGMMQAKAKGDKTSMMRIAKEIPKYASKIKG